MTDLFQIKEYNKFRHAAELKKDTHGGYLEGSLPIPSELIDEDFELELSLISSSFSSRYEHPNLLHFTDLQVGKNRRRVSVYKTEVTQDSWKMVFQFFGSRPDAIHLFKSESGVNKSIKIHDCRKGNSIIFGGEFGLTLTIITPLQNVGKGGKGVTISQVLENRYSNKTIDWLKNADFHDPKIELHRCRMHAVFRSAAKQFKISILSNNIFDLSNKYVGRLSIQAIHNVEDIIYGSIGKKEVSLITKQKIDPKEVFPHMMIKSDNGTFVDPSKLYPGFSQISSDTMKCYHNTTLIFDIPSQSSEILDQISNAVFYICLHRRVDRRISEPIKSFIFEADFVEDFMSALNKKILEPIDTNNNCLLPPCDIPSPADSGFVSAGPSPLMSNIDLIEDMELDSNNEMFQNYLDFDMNDLDAFNFPINHSLISEDNGLSPKGGSEKKDIDIFTKIFEDSFSIQPKSQASEVKGFPTLTLKNSDNEAKSDEQSTNEREVISNKKNNAPKLSKILFFIKEFFNVLIFISIAAFFTWIFLENCLNI